MTKEEFLQSVDNFSNHRYLLWPALEATKGMVIEMGMGYGSTPYLWKYCHEHNRELVSFENSREWYDKLKGQFPHKIFFVEDWDVVSDNWPEPDVLLIDHAPGERRHIDIARFANNAKIIVVHDSEPAATGYMLDKIWQLFKYRIDHKTSGAWATAVSNFIDVSKWEI